jgi:hypothetical protein
MDALMMVLTLCLTEIASLKGEPNHSSAPGEIEFFFEKNAKFQGKL